MFKLSHFLLMLIPISLTYSSKVELDLLMPNVSPKNKDTYLCKKFKMGEEPVYITEFEANSSKAIAHHILLFACDQVGEEDVWNCGEMHQGNNADIYKQGPVCTGSKLNIIFAWALDAPKLVLPDNVGFKLGGNTDKKYLVMQVHYANVDKFINGGTDNSGLKLKGQTEPVENTAGVYLLQTGGYIEPAKTEYFESACEMTENVVLHPFAFRTHAHKLGVVNSGYVVKTKPDGSQEWIEIGRRSPQLPQMFYPATNQVEVNKGDVLVGRCTMHNFVDHTVSIGATGEDEMCNFYVMYYVKGDKTLDSTNCLTFGPPYWHLNNFRGNKGRRLDLSKMPKDASQVPKEQEEEMSDMKNHHGMHGMANNEESKINKNMPENESSEIENLLKSNKINSSLKEKLINSLLNEYENQLASAENSQEASKENNDELENYLNELEKEYHLRKLLKKFNLN